METIKLVSVNIETDVHLDVVLGFLRQEKPDVVCMQEVFEEDLQWFGKELGMKSVFGQMNQMGRIERMKPPRIPYGIGILSALPIRNDTRSYYQGSVETASTYIFNGVPRNDHRLLLHATFQKGGVNFTIGTTHFIWTPDGRADDLQRQNQQRLLAIVQEVPDIVLCGDFNAPRGGEIFAKFEQQYKDNIPKQYTTSLDLTLHRARERLRGRALMVDCLFTTPEYECSNVRLQHGVSDHMAIVADISKKEK